MKHTIQSKQTVTVDGAILIGITIFFLQNLLQIESINCCVCCSSDEVADDAVIVDDELK